MERERENGGREIDRVYTNIYASLLPADTRLYASLLPADTCVATARGQMRRYCPQTHPVHQLFAVVLRKSCFAVPAPGGSFSMGSSLAGSGLANNRDGERDAEQSDGPAGRLQLSQEDSGSVEAPRGAPPNTVLFGRKLHSGDFNGFAGRSGNTSSGTLRLDPRAGAGKPSLTVVAACGQ